MWLVYHKGGQLLYQEVSTLLWISEGRRSFSGAESKNSFAIVLVRKYVFLRFQHLKLCYLLLLIFTQERKIKNSKSPWYLLAVH